MIIKQALTLVALVLAASSQAQVITIDQAKALAGNVTPGDAPGFPVTITQPGSYRLAGNLTVADINLGAIHIQSAGEVTLDLGGFVIKGGRCGPARCATTTNYVHGIRAENYYQQVRPRVVIRNGFVTEFGGDGLWIEGIGSRLEGVRAEGNGRNGASVKGGSVVDSIFVNNLGIGLSTSHGLARGNLIRGNGAAQLHISDNSVLVTGNTLLGPSPLIASGNTPVISNGDNLCAPNYTFGQPC